MITIGILGWDSNVQSYAQVSDSQIVILNESFSHPKTKIRMAAEWPSDQEKPEDEAPRVMDIDEDSASAPFTDEKKIMIQVSFVLRCQRRVA